MKKLEFCEHFIYLRNRPICFAARRYLEAPYNSDARRVVIRASRQVEKSTFLVNSILYTAVTHPGAHILFVCPRQQQASVFSGSRLLPIIYESPVLRKTLIGQRRRRLPVMNLRFANRSEVYIRAAYHSADAVRGIDADLLLVDEFQDIASGDLPVLEETLSHSRLRRVLLTGTPKTIDNHLEGVFGQSTACEWNIRCAGCGHEAIPDENCLGPHAPVCPQCQGPIHPGAGHWVPRNPQSTWGEGFWINHLLVPWVNYQELLDRQRTYDPALFRNECLGLPTTLGDHIVTRAELEACCTRRPMAQSLADVPRTMHTRMMAGVDWGGGATSRTVLAIGYMQDDNHFVVSRLEWFPGHEEPEPILAAIAQRCRQFQVFALAADGGGNGNVYNNLLLDRLPQLRVLRAVIYSASDHPPQPYKGRLWHWTIARSASIGMVFSRVKKQLLLFPRVEDCSSYLDEICCEVAEYDDHQRTVKYTHPQTQPDDTLHAINYVSTMARYWLVEKWQYE